jgi:hypothetical protein
MGQIYPCEDEHVPAAVIGALVLNFFMVRAWRRGEAINPQK